MPDQLPAYVVWKAPIIQQVKIQAKEVGYSLMKELIEKEIDEFKMELLPLSEIMKEKIE